MYSIIMRVFYNVFLIIRIRRVYMCTHIRKTKIMMEPHGERQSIYLKKREYHTN